jgi:type II restriction/modification system DNA methylase subunit YeeA
MKLPEQQSIISCVQTILAAKKQNPAAATSALEREIDQQVYALYGLTREEIAIVEGTAP